MSGVVACLLLIASCSADPMAVSGVHGDIRQQKFAELAWLGAQWDVPALDIAPRWRLHYELDAGVIDARPDDRKALNLMLGPALQWHHPAAEWTFIIEGGLRPAYVDRTVFNGRAIGGSFHFASHVGAVFRMTRLPFQVGARFLHISNGGIRSDNPGMNYALFSFGYYWYPQGELRSSAGTD